MCPSAAARREKAKVFALTRTADAGVVSVWAKAPRTSTVTGRPDVGGVQSPGACRPGGRWWSPVRRGPQAERYGAAGTS
ncbi:hypothetical protein [Streptomyces corynorhini]|uniref:Uncharacterized protein n=1 Tax=Streptomyces corynorhini TaxID=2282652 RepID=A0A370AV58_9ACTN|nr:hypothetical protein [Streptomyces corynorhini]RDG33470.1 hypothetical protein DVH02_31350 [Streptomyces corynorhini]